MDNREAIKDKRWKTLVERYGSEDAVLQMLREAQKKSRLAYDGKKRAQSIPKEKRIAIARKAAQARWKKSTPTSSVSE